MVDDPTTDDRVLDPEVWRARRTAHLDRVEELIGPYLRARRRGRKHPVIDFLFTYYSSRPAHIRRWHPGYGVVLADGTDYLGLPGYHRVDGGVTAAPELLADRRGAIEANIALLSATADRTARLGCFGLHEWAMVYRTDEVRHALPLRLGAAGTDAVVESMPLRCTHFDAYRFFTEAARPRNAITSLTRDTQLDHEQPGCLHATMDLYRTCFLLGPLIDSRLTLAAFEVALAARELDMAAGPYDLSEFGYAPVAVETPAGRAHYVREQTAIAARGTRLRGEILAAITALAARSREVAHQPITTPDVR